MDFTFSKNEKLLQNAVREYMRDRVLPIAAQENPKVPLPKKDVLDILTSLISLGYIGSQIPMAQGGPGLTHTETGILFQELGKVWASLGAIVMANANATFLTAASKNGHLIEKWLDALLNADVIGCVALTEPGAGTDLSEMETTARLEKDTFIINGTKTWVSNGAIADVAIVAVKMRGSDENRPSFGYLLVEKKISPFHTIETPKMGLKGLSTAVLKFSDCPVPEGNRLEIQGRAPDQIKPKNLPDNYLIPMLAIGIGEAALDAAVTYARQRIQFGKELGRFQMIQKMIAEMATQMDAAKLLCYRALKLMDEGTIRPRESAMAMAFAKTTATDVASKAIQIHGAYGYSDEFPMERYYRDAASLTVMAGTPSLHQLKIAENILGINAMT